MPGIGEMLNANHIASQQGGYEPQRQANWKLELMLPTEGDSEIIALSLESAELPKESNEEIELHFGNEVRYVAGKAKYETTPLIVKDFVDSKTAESIIRWRQLVYQADTGVIGFASDYKVTGELKLFGPNGGQLKGETDGLYRSWNLIGLWPQAAHYGTLNMTGNDKVVIEVTLRYDKALPNSRFDVDHTYTMYRS